MNPSRFGRRRHRLDKVRYGAAAQSETAHQMLIGRDIRVLLVRWPDHIHNARTAFVPVSAAKKAQETLEIYAPLAHRLGMNMVKWELEGFPSRPVSEIYRGLTASLRKAPSA